MLAILFGFWPFLQVRASWNLSFAYPFVVSTLLMPIATKVFFPRVKTNSVSTYQSTANSTNGQSDETTTGNTTMGNNDDDNDKAAAVGGV